MSESLKLLTRAMLAREVNAGLLLGLLAMGGAGFVLARVAERILADEWLPTTIAAIVVRGDVTLLAVSLCLIVLRTASRAAEDCRDAWVDPWVTTREARWQYGVALMASVLTPGLLLAAVGSAVFGVTAAWLTGSTELLAAWPLLVARTVVLALVLASGTVVLALLIRDTGGTVLASAVVFLGPFAAVALYSLLEAGSLLERTLDTFLILSPHGSLPRGWRGIGTALIHVAAFTALGTVASRRYGGRRP